MLLRLNSKQFMTLKWEKLWRKAAGNKDAPFILILTVILDVYWPHYYVNVFIKAFLLLYRFIIDFKMLQLVYYSHYLLTQQPKAKILFDVLEEFKLNRPPRSLGRCQLVAPQVRTKHTEAAFSYCAAHRYIQLPDDQMLSSTSHCQILIQTSAVFMCL